jgi:hypothetical protein
MKGTQDATKTQVLRAGWLCDAGPRAENFHGALEKEFEFARFDPRGRMSFSGFGMVARRYKNAFE